MAKREKTLAIIACQGMFYFDRFIQVENASERYSDILRGNNADRCFMYGYR
jgi:hypothetical protein